MSETPPCPYEALLEDEWFQSEWFERSVISARFFSDSQQERTVIQHLDRMANKPGVYANAMLDSTVKLANARCCEYWRNAHKREDLDITLENDSRFYNDYLGALQNGRGLSERITIVQRWIRKLVPNWCSHPVPGKDYDQARTLALYFDERYKPAPKKAYPTTLCGEITLPTPSHDDAIAHGIGAFCTLTINPNGLVSGFGYSSSTPTPIENTMTKAITITTKTFANGNDVATMSDSEIYNLIAAQEAEIRELEKITAKPKRLVKEIESRQAGVKALVDYLDTKE